MPEEKPEWTAGRSLLALLVFAFGFSLFAAGIHAVFSTLYNATNALNLTNAPPELLMMRDIVRFVAWTLTVPVFVAILIAASFIKEALERR